MLAALVDVEARRRVGRVVGHGGGPHREPGHHERLALSYHSVGAAVARYHAADGDPGTAHATGTAESANLLLLWW